MDKRDQDLLTYRRSVRVVELNRLGNHWSTVYTSLQARKYRKVNAWSPVAIMEWVFSVWIDGQEVLTALDKDEALKQARQKLSEVYNQKGKQS